MKNSRKALSFLQIIGPGLLMAGAAVGVSHLVQATRAGAQFGFGLLGIILLSNVLKYPFFQYGHRYTSATGKNLLEGYKGVGKPFLALFLLFNIITSVTSTASILFVTSSLSSTLFHIENPLIMTVLVIGVCLCLLSMGEFKVIDTTIKIVISLLILCTFSTILLAVFDSSGKEIQWNGGSPWTWTSLPFLLALMGWMPAPIEISVWQSLWIKDRDESIGQKATLKESLLDFNFGYALTVLLAVAFLSLGALIMFQTGQSFPDSGVAFAEQFVDMYCNTLGQWARPLVAIAAMSAMFSTSLTVMDAYPHSLAEGFRLLSGNKKYQKKHYWIWMGFVCLSSLGLVSFYVESLKELVDLATTLSFLTAPFLAGLNCYLICSKETPQEYQPGIALKVLSFLGLIFLTGFALLFLYLRF